jgi:hypothetical protein
MMLGKAGSTRRCSPILAIGCTSYDRCGWNGAHVRASTGSTLPIPGSCPSNVGSASGASMIGD